MGTGQSFPPALFLLAPRGCGHSMVWPLQLPRRSVSFSATDFAVETFPLITELSEMIKLATSEVPTQ